MADVALIVSVLAALAAIASAVSSHRSAEAARRTSTIEADRRHDELAPRLELVPHKVSIHSENGQRTTYLLGGMVTNHGPRQYRTRVRWDGEVRPSSEDDPRDPDTVQPSGLVVRDGDSVAFVAEINLGSLAIGENRFVQSANFKEGERVAFTFECSDDDGRGWTQQHGMRWPKLTDKWPSSSVENR